MRPAARAGLIATPAAKKDGVQSFRQVHELLLESENQGTSLRHLMWPLDNPVVIFHFCVAARATARNRAADAAISVELFRRRHGRLPARLDELVPEYLPQVPQDPFTGEWMHYTTNEENYLIYSVGEDSKDDHGNEKHLGRPDVVFSVPVTMTK